MNTTNRSSSISRLAALLIAAVLVVAAPGPVAVAKMTVGPDLQVIDLKLKPADGGDKLDIQFKVKNGGNAKAQSVLVWIHVGPNGKESRQMDKLEDGKSKSFELKVDYPNLPNPQERLVRVVADPNHSIPELDETNNQAIEYFDPSPATLPDLEVDQVKIEQTKVTPPVAKVTVRVKNRGKAASSNFDLYVWQPENPGYKDIFVLPGLKKGESREINFTSGPVNTDPATYIAEVDPLNKVQESSEANNRGSAQKKIKVDATLPDLVVKVTKVELTSGIRTGLRVQYSVRNAGGSDVPFPIVISLRQEQGALQGDATIQSGLKKGESNDRTASFNLPPDPKTVFGTRLTITAQSQSMIVESNDSNNTATITIPDPNAKTIGPALNPNAPLEAQP